MREDDPFSDPWTCPLGPLDHYYSAGHYRPRWSWCRKKDKPDYDLISRLEWELLDRPSRAGPEKPLFVTQTKL